MPCSPCKSHIHWCPSVLADSSIDVCHTVPLIRLQSTGQIECASVYRQHHSAKGKQASVPSEKLVNRRFLISHHQPSYCSTTGALRAPVSESYPDLTRSPPCRSTRSPHHPRASATAPARPRPSPAAHPGVPGRETRVVARPHRPARTRWWTRTGRQRLASAVAEALPPPWISDSAATHVTKPEPES